MKVVILLNGEPYTGKIEAENSYVLCCDGAYKWAKGRVKIDENLGDFDSLDCVPEPPPKEVYPSEKNATDGEIAIERAIALGASEITVYGGGGGREDHFLGNLHLLYKAHRAGVKAAMVTNHAVIFADEDEVGLCCKRGTTISIVPFGGDAHILHSSGFKYPLEDLWLRYGSTRGISNVIEDEEATFFSEGTVLVFVDHN